MIFSTAIVHSFLFFRLVSADSCAHGRLKKSPHLGDEGDGSWVNRELVMLTLESNIWVIHVMHFYASLVLFSYVWNGWIYVRYVHLNSCKIMIKYCLRFLQFPYLDDWACIKTPAAIWVNIPQLTLLSNPCCLGCYGVWLSWQNICQNTGPDWPQKCHPTVEGFKANTGKLLFLAVT